MCKQVVEDKTFGLKNKNKSKVIQKFVQEVTKGSKMAGMSKDEFLRKEKEAQMRNDKKADKKDREAELRALFAPAVSKKDKEKEKQKAEEAARKKEEPEEEMMTSQEAYNDAKRADDLAKAEAILGEQQDDDIYGAIEKERAELRKKGGLTPVTYDSFVAWKDRKAKERAAADLEASKQAALKAAKEMRGKSGRDLFNQLVAMGDALLMDDEEADDDWMVREQDSDDEEIFDIQVTGTTFSLSKVDKDKKVAAAGNAQAKGEEADDAEAGVSMDKLAGSVDASLFLDDDVDLPSDDDDDE